MSTLKTGDHRPESGSYTLTLQEFDIRVVSSGRLQVEILIPETEKRTSSTYNEYLQILLLDDWLRDIYVSSSGSGAVGTAVGDYQSYAGNRQYRLTFSDDTTNTVTVHSVAFVTTVAGYVTYYGITFEPVSGSLDISEWETYLAARTQSILASGVATKTPMGSDDQPLNAQSIQFDNDRKLGMERGVPIFQVKEDGGDIHRKVVLGHDRMVNYADLTAHSDGVSKLLPSPADRILTNTIHVSGLTGNAKLRMQDPTKMALLPYNHRTVAIHNRDSTYYTDILDWDGATKIRVNKKQKAVLSFAAHGDGGGEVFGASLPPRLMLGNAGVTNSFGDLPYYSYDSASQWVRSVPLLAESAFDQIDTDAFTIGSQTFTNGLALTNNLIHTAQTFTVNKPGELYYKHILQIGIDDAAIGSLLAVSLYIFRRRSNVVTAFEVSSQKDLTPNSSGRLLVWEFIEEALAGDLIAPVLIYAQSNTMNPGHVLISSVRIFGSLKPEYSQDYTP